MHAHRRGDLVVGADFTAWAVERTFAWLTAHRGLARDYERDLAARPSVHDALPAGAFAYDSYSALGGDAPCRVHAPVATGVYGDGLREILGLQDLSYSAMVVIGAAPGAVLERRVRAEHVSRTAVRRICPRCNGGRRGRRRDSRRSEDGRVGAHLSPDDRLDAAVALLNVGQQGAAGTAGEVRDERGMPAVQRREDVPEVVLARPPDPAQGRADRARLTEHGQLLVRQLPERPPARAVHRGGGQRTDPSEDVPYRRPADTVEPAVQQLADQHVLVPPWPHGSGVEPGPANAGTCTHRPWQSGDRKRSGRGPRA